MDHNRYRLHFSLLGLYAAGILLLALTPHADVGSWCLFHRITGYPCPACGTGHGVLAVLHGNFGYACRYNPLSLMVLPAAVYVLWLITTDLMHRGTRLQDFLRQVNEHFHIRKPQTQLLIMLVIFNWIWNFYKY